MSNAGKFRERVTIFSPGVAIADEVGGFVASSPETAIEVAAQVQVMAAKEVYLDSKTIVVQPYKVTIRYTADIDSATRIVWNGHKLNVVSVQPDVRKTELVIRCNGSD